MLSEGRVEKQRRRTKDELDQVASAGIFSPKPLPSTNRPDRTSERFNVKLMQKQKHKCNLKKLQGTMQGGQSVRGSGVSVFSCPWRGS